MKIIAGTEQYVYSRQSACTYKHQCAASPTIDGEQCDECKDNVCHSCDDYIEEYIADIVTCRLEYFLCVVENDICAAPLLKHCYDDSKYKYLAVFMTEEHLQSTFLVCCRCTAH